MRQKLNIEYKNQQENDEKGDNIMSIYDERNVSSQDKPIYISRRLYGDQCRIEAYHDGLYLRVCKSNELVLLRNISIASNETFMIKEEKYEKIYHRTNVKEDYNYIGFLSYHDFDNEVHFYPLFADNVIIPLK